MIDRPNPWQRALTVELRQLRKNAGLTREEAAAAMEWYGSKVTRLETGDWKRIQIHDLRGLLTTYGVTTPEQQERYLKLARRVRQHRWWDDYADVAVDYTAFEDEASGIQTYEPFYVPGLAQTEDYARALIQADPLIEHDETERRVAVRMERQKQKPLDRDGPQFRAIIDEAVIRRPVGGPKTMVDQLRHLIEAAEATQRVNLQVLPFHAGAHPGMEGPFVILRFPDPVERPIIYLETSHDGLYPEGEQAVERYNVMYEHLLAMALSPRDSVAMMEDVIGGLRMAM